MSKKSAYLEKLEREKKCSYYILVTALITGVYERIPAAKKRTAATGGQAE